MSEGAVARTRTRRRSRFSREQRRQAAVALAALAGACTMAEPTGTVVVDQLWGAAIGAAAALAGSYGGRGPLLVAAGLAGLFGPDRLSLAIALVGVVCAITSTADLRRPAPFLRGLGGGAAACALLVASGHDRAALLSWLAWAGVAAPLVASAYRHAPRRVRQRASSVTMAVAGVALVACLAAGFGALQARQRLDRGAAALEAGLEAARGGNVEEARRQLRTAASALDGAASDVGTWGLIARAVPGAAQNVDAIRVVLDAAAASASTAEDAAGAVDSDSLIIDGGALDLDAVRSLAAPLGRLEDALAHTAEQIDDLADVPLLPPVRSRLDRVGPEVQRALDDARTGARAASVVPGMLGADGPRRYLVLFTSPAEARGRFGFPAAYGVVEADGGQLRLEVAESIGELQGNVIAEQSTMPLDDPLIQPYTTYGATFNWRSVTVPPDFPSVARIAEELWRQTGSGEIDGVLRLDTSALASLLTFTGPVTVERRDEPLTVETFGRYLDFDQYVEYGDEGSGERREVLEDVAGTVFDALLATDLPGPRGIVDVLGPIVEEGHLQVTSYDEEAMAFLDAVGLTGRFAPPTTPDALAVANINVTGNKIDAFLTREVRYEATVADDGTISATATVRLTNTASATGLPDYVIGSALPQEVAPPPGTNRTVALLWSALPLGSVTVDGEAGVAASNPTGGWWVHGIQLDVPPGATVEVIYTLAGPPAVPGSYALHVEPGGGSLPDELAVEVRDAEGTTLLATSRTVRHPLDLDGQTSG